MGHQRPPELRALSPRVPEGGVRSELAGRGHMADRPERQADPPVPQRRQVDERLLDRDGVVRRDLRDAQILVGGVDQHHRHPSLAQRPAVLRARVREAGADEDDAADVLLQQHLYVVRLGDPVGRPGAQHRDQPPLVERPRERLGERREDRVLQIGHHQADQRRPGAPQLRGPLEAEDVERRQHRVAGRLRHVGPAVQHATDRRLADAGKSGNFGESFRHGNQPTGRYAKTKITYARR